MFWIESGVVVLNAHCGDLPRFRGNACPNWAILNGEDRIAIAIHRMSTEVDAGPIFEKEYFDVSEDTYIADVYHWMNNAIPRLFVTVIERLESGSAMTRPVEQPLDPALSLRCFPRRPEDSLIDWDQSAQHIHRLIRAGAKPFPGAYTYFEGKRISIWRASLAKWDLPSLFVPGQIADIDTESGFVTVLCGRDALRLEQVSLAGDAPALPSRYVRSLRQRFGHNLSKAYERLQARIYELEARLEFLNNQGDL